MGPPPFGDGKLWAYLQALEGKSPASMGPPPFGDGKIAKALGKGKDTVLQWGHRLSAMESP